MIPLPVVVLLLVLGGLLVVGGRMPGTLRSGRPNGSGRVGGVGNATPPAVRAAAVRSVRRPLVGGCLGAAALGGLVTWLVVPLPAMAGAGALLALRLPLVVERRRREVERRARRQAWPEAVDLLAAAVRSGETLAGALGAVAERGPGPLRGPFAAVVADHRLSGDLAGSLRRMAESLADPTADRVAVTLAFAQRAGGSGLGGVLRALSAFLREDLALRGEIVARQSWTVTAARVAAAAPWVVLLLVASRPASLDVYRSSGGALVILVGVLSTMAGYRAMLALGRLPEEPRLLVGREHR